MTGEVTLDILIVEDDADARGNLRDILELDGHRIDEAATASEALGRAGLPAYSAILLDRKLPDATAADLLPLLKQRAPTADVLILTGFSDVEGAISALRLGAADYLLKPINPDELRARLARLAKHRRAERELRKRSLILQSVLGQVADAAIVVDRHGRILLHSPSVGRLIGPIRIGAPPEEWPSIGRFFRPDMVTPYTREELPLFRALQGEEVIDEELYVRPSGDHPGRWMSANATPLRDPAGPQGGGGHPPRHHRAQAGPGPCAALRAPGGDRRDGLRAGSREPQRPPARPGLPRDAHPPGGRSPPGGGPRRPPPEGPG